jgi:hypothetical protein
MKNQGMFDVGQLDPAAKLVAAGVFVALIVDGMDLQMLALSPEQEERHNYSGVLHSALLHCRSVLYNVRAFLAVVRWIDGDKMKDFVRVLVDATADPAT